MRSDQDRHTIFGELINQIPESAPCGRIYARGGLVEEEQLGFMHQRDPQRESLAPPGGEGTGQRGVMSLESHKFQGVLDAGFVLNSVHAAIKRQILQYGQVIIDREPLRHISGARAYVFTLFEGIEAEHGRLAVTGRDQAEQHPYRRRFARAVRAKIPHDFTRAYIKADVVHRDEITETAREIFDLDNWFHHESLPYLNVRKRWTPIRIER